MGTPTVLSPEEEKLKEENDTLRRRIQMLEAELQSLRQRLASVWGEA